MGRPGKMGGAGRCGLVFVGAGLLTGFFAALGVFSGASVELGSGTWVFLYPNDGFVSRPGWSVGRPARHLCCPLDLFYSVLLVTSVSDSNPGCVQWRVDLCQRWRHVAHRAPVVFVPSGINKHNTAWVGHALIAYVCLSCQPPSLPPLVLIFLS